MFGFCSVCFLFGCKRYPSSTTLSEEGIKVSPGFIIRTDARQPVVEKAGALVWSDDPLPRAPSFVVARRRVRLGKTNQKMRRQKTYYIQQQSKIFPRSLSPTGHGHGTSTQSNATRAKHTHTHTHARQGKTRQGKLNKVGQGTTLLNHMHQSTKTFTTNN